MDYYRKNPLYVAEIDSKTKKNKKIYYFLGDVPTAVIKAAQNQWSTQAEIKTLTDFYGNNFRVKLTPEEPITFDTFGLAQAKLMSSMKFFDVIEGGDFSGFDNMLDESTENNIIQNDKEYKIVYTNISIFPEDTIFDLRCKLQLVSSIPFYRQHFFYFINDEGPIIPYKLTIDGAPVIVNWEDLCENTTGDSSIAGLFIDQKFEEGKANINITAHDTFELLERSSGINVTKAYFVDLFDAIDITNLNKGTLNDKYQFDLLYYGGILKYWPQLTHDAAFLALSNPQELLDKYPLLAQEIPTRQSELAILAAKWHPPTISKVAILAATIRILPKSTSIHVSIRNIFDYISLSESLLAVKASFDIDATLLSDAGIAAAGISSRQSDLIPVTVSKRHASSYQLQLAPIIDKFLSKSKNIEKNSVVFVILRKNEKGINAMNAIVYFTLHSSGVIEATTNWREDDSIDFGDVNTQVMDKISPLLDRINKMKAMAFPTGGDLTLDVKSRAITIGAITISMFWPHVLSASEFKLMKEQFREYDSARIINIKGLQSSNNGFTMHFHKGIVKYEHISFQEITNEYSWLTEPSITAKWNYTYSGRIIHIFHRLSDLKIEIIGAENYDEFITIRKYIYSFLEKFLVTKSKLSVTSASKKVPVVDKLKLLQESDPNLFDMKKYDKNANVYSVICQSKRQPILSDSESKKAVKFWNFTENKPAYYECPNRVYPHLSFRADQHPLGYCIPCCKKTKPKSDIKVYNNCISSYTAENTPTQFSGHVLQYGKPIGIDRISYLPEELSKGLFLNLVEKPFNFYLLGVPQSTPAVPEAGFMFALAHAVAMGEETIEYIITELASAAANMTDTYYLLGDGAGAVFKSASVLAETILRSFINIDGGFTDFSPGGIAAQWHQIMIDLVRITFGIEVLILVDDVGQGLSIELSIAEMSAQTIINLNSDFVIILSNPDGYYPIGMLDEKFYVKAEPHERWMLVRKIFCEKYENEEEVEDKLLKVVKDLLKMYLARFKKNDIDIVALREYSALPDSKFEIDLRLINIHNLCYGVMMRRKNNTTSKDQIYIPIVNTIYMLDGEVDFGIRPNKLSSHQVLMEVIDDINKFIKTTKYNPIKITKTLLSSDGKQIGFSTDDALFYFHEAITAPKLDSSSSATIKIPYDCRDIDEKILLHINDIPILSQKAKQSDINNKMYKLILAEFSSIIKLESNKEIRIKLKKIISEIDFESSKSVAHFRQSLVDIIKNDYDLELIRKIVTRAYTIAPNEIKEEILKTFDTTRFNFDNQLLIRLKQLNHSETVDELRKVMSPYLSQNDTIKNVNNIYTSCIDNPAGDHCSDTGKLQISTKQIEEFYDILAADIHNPSKSYILTVIASGVFDALEFIPHSGEYLNISFN